MVQIRTPWIFQDLVEELDRMARVPSWAFGGLEALNGRAAGAFEVQDDKATLQLDLPGVTDDDIEIGLENNRLRIQARRGDERLESEDVVLRERSHGEFSRDYRLPWPVAEEGVDAHLEQGILTLELTRAPESAPRRIQVKSA